jgi:hypothetical protein
VSVTQLSAQPVDQKGAATHRRRCNRSLLTADAAIGHQRLRGGLEWISALRRSGRRPARGSRRTRRRACSLRHLEPRLKLVEMRARLQKAFGRVHVEVHAGAEIAAAPVHGHSVAGVDRVFAAGTAIRESARGPRRSLTRARRAEDFHIWSSRPTIQMRGVEHASEDQGVAGRDGGLLSSVLWEEAMTLVPAP